MQKPGFHHPNPSGTAEVDETNLYVTQLPEVFSEIQLHELFGRFGPIVSSRIMKDQCKPCNAIVQVMIIIIAFIMSIDILYDYKYHAVYFNHPIYLYKNMHIPMITAGTHRKTRVNFLFFSR